MRLGEQDVQDFAHASGDCNPLHLDADFARRTPYGRPIAHGALVIMTVLPAIGQAGLLRLSQLDARLRRPIFPGSEYRLPGKPATAGDRHRLVVESAGEVALQVRVRTDADRDFPAPYASTGPLRELMAQLGAADVPDQVLALLAWSSWMVGMQVPGRDSLLSAIDLSLDREFGDPAHPAEVQVVAVDERTGGVRIQARWHGAHGSAKARIEAFERRGVPAPTRSTVGRWVAPSDRLADRRVLVMGGSRGLGAAVVGVFATQAATVWVGYARSADRVTALQEEFGDRVRPVACDATDPVEVRATMDEIASDGRGLDGIVLCATPPLATAAVHPEAVDAALGNFTGAVRMTLLSLTAALPLLEETNGWVALVSSSAVSDPPRGWALYTAAKAAIEHYGACVARQHGRPVLVLRPPKMWTDMVNGPTGPLGAVPTEQVAATLLDWSLGEEAGQARLCVRGTEDLVPEREAAHVG